MSLSPQNRLRIPRSGVRIPPDALVKSRVLPYTAKPFFCFLLPGRCTGLPVIKRTACPSTYRTLPTPPDPIRRQRPLSALTGSMSAACNGIPAHHPAIGSVWQLYMEPFGSSSFNGRRPIKSTITSDARFPPGYKPKACRTSNRKGTLSSMTAARSLPNGGTTVSAKSRASCKAKAACRQKHLTSYLHSIATPPIGRQLLHLLQPPPSAQSSAKGVRPAGHHAHALLLPYAIRRRRQ